MWIHMDQHGSGVLVFGGTIHGSQIFLAGLGQRWPGKDGQGRPRTSYRHSGGAGVVRFLIEVC